MTNGLADILETTEAQRLATGFVFTEGPLWHPDGFYYFVDVRASRLYRIVPGGSPELVREKTGGGNGTTFDLQGRLVICEGDNRRVTLPHAPHLGLQPARPGARPAPSTLPFPEVTAT